MKITARRRRRGGKGKKEEVDESMQAKKEIMGIERRSDIERERNGANIQALGCRDKKKREEV